MIVSSGLDAFRSPSPEPVREITCTSAAPPALTPDSTSYTFVGLLVGVHSVPSDDVGKENSSRRLSGYRGRVIEEVRIRPGVREG